MSRVWKRLARLCSVMEAKLTPISPIMHTAPPPVWHHGLSRAQANEIERVQKRCLIIIYPERFLFLDSTLYNQDEKISLVIYFGKLKTKIIFVTHFYPNEKRIYGYQKLVSLYNPNYQRFQIWSRVYCNSKRF